MAQASTQKPASEPWVPLLASPDAADRLAAIKIITYLPESSEEIVRLLEQTALHDADEAVCQAAENALLAYPNQPVYRSLVGRDETARQFMLYELTRLELAGLMGGRAARLSKARYSLAPLDNPNPIVKTEIPDPVAAANIPTEPAASK